VKNRFMQFIKAERGATAVTKLKQAPRVYYFTLALALIVFTGCFPVSRPTLNEVRMGQGRGQPASDTTLRPGEIRAEVTEIDPSRREIRVRTDDGRREVLVYDINRTLVTYHGREYSVDQLQAGDLIAFQTPPRNSYIDVVRIQEPLQARSGIASPSRSPQPARPDVVEGTVERVAYDLGAFDVRSRTGRTVTVSVPYNAKTADVESFRRLRRGDYVRVEGEFVSSDNLQLLAFLTPR
jgi:hypothetical protein